MIQFFYFHLIPWPHLPEDFDRGHPSSWVTLSNRFYDPQRGHVLYNEYLDEIQHAEARLTASATTTPPSDLAAFPG